MILNKYQKEKKEATRKEVLIYHKKGLSLRKIGALMGKSHEWARLVIKSYAQEDLTKVDR